MCEKEKTQLVAEVNILRELRNPFIVRYHDRIVDKVQILCVILTYICTAYIFPSVKGDIINASRYYIIIQYTNSSNFIRIKITTHNYDRQQLAYS